MKNIDAEMSWLLISDKQLSFQPHAKVQRQTIRKRPQFPKKQNVRSAWPNIC